MFDVLLAIVQARSPPVASLWAEVTGKDAVPRRRNLGSNVNVVCFFCWYGSVDVTAVFP